MKHPATPTTPCTLACLAGAALLALQLALASPVAAQAVAGCNFEFNADAAGPFDYRNQRKSLQTVERRHFTPRVERLAGGESTTQPGPDIDYTLSKFPNHHRALLALSRLSIKLRTASVPEMRYPVDCYFERALRFRADDTVARLAYALHLSRTGRRPEARQQLVTAGKQAQDSPITHVNVGLLALEIGDAELALTHAHRAQELGLAKNNLRAALDKAGRWREPDPAAAPAAPASASASASAPTPAASAP
jgi:hypothetical protein